MDEGFQALILKELRAIRKRTPSDFRIAAAVFVGIVGAVFFLALVLPAFVATVLAVWSHNQP